VDTTLKGFQARGLLTGFRDSSTLNIWLPFVDAFEPSGSTPTQKAGTASPASRENLRP
jgi:hypothetical protein